MSFQAYLDNVKAKTGKAPADFAKLAAQKGFTKHGEILAWLKSEFDLGHGHATAIAGVVLKGGSPPRSRSQKLDTLFSGTKAALRAPSDALIEKIARFGPDAVASPNATYVKLLRGTKKFGIIQPAAASRLDIGIKLKGQPATKRFAAAGDWNAMVTHRVRIESAQEVDAEVLAWLKRAYDAA